MSAETPLNLKSLFYCRTPLQLKIAQRIIDINNLSRNYFLIYHPTNNNKKHSYYYKNLKTKNKIFIKFLDKFPFILGELFAWNRLPRIIKNSSFSEIYFASLNSILLSKLSTKNTKAELNLFDDGLLNINKKDFYYMINFDHSLHVFFRTILSIHKNQDILKRINTHYTIYDPKMSEWMPCKSAKINLFKSDLLSRERISNSRVKLRILIGNTFGHIKKSSSLIHDEISRSNKFDIFIPHPASKLEFRSPDFLKDVISKNMIENFVAEDIIFELTKNGYTNIILYGFSSSVLLNLREHTKSVSILLNESLTNNLELDLAKSLRRTGIKIISDDPSNGNFLSINQFNKLASYS